MKKLLFAILVICASLGIYSCSNKGEKPQMWEYMTYTVSGTAWDKFHSKYIPIPTEELNKLGQEGWELVSVFTEVETVHPNFGNERYVIGLQPNTRTHNVVCIFKRPAQEKVEEKGVAEAVEEVVVVDTAEVVETTALN